jgi:hypothetical protein
MNKLVDYSIACLFFVIPMAAMTSSADQVKDTPAPSEECVLSLEDYAVYSAVLLDRGKPEDPEERWDDKPDLIISDVTDSGEDGKSRMWGFRSVSKQNPSNDTVEHFNSRRQSPCQLKPQLSAAILYRFLSKKEHDNFFKKKGVGGWKDFYKRYPKSSGFWSFSLVGYDTNGTEALVYVGHHCGGLCGTGHLVLLAKEDGNWMVRNRVMLWIS